jgi:hypothetical protein
MLFNTTGGARKNTVGSIILDYFDNIWPRSQTFYNHNCQDIVNYACDHYDKLYSYGTIERQVRKLREEGKITMFETKDGRKEKGWIISK